jgi:phasin family protein
MPSYANRPPLQPGFESQMNFMTELTRKTSDSVRKLSELNLQFAHQMLLDSFDATRRIMACTDPLQLASTAVNAAQPSVEHLRTYQQQLVSLMTGSQLELVRGAAPFMGEGSRYTQALTSTMARGNGASHHGESAA